MSDGRLVYIKIVETNSDELKIATFFSSGALARNPRNRCVPILDHFPDDGNPSITYMIMPFLVRTLETPFETVANVVDFVDQILEVCPIVASTSCV